jgi:hypothetical protein
MKVRWSRGALKSFNAMRAGERDQDHSLESGLAGRVQHIIEQLRFFPQAGVFGTTPATREMQIPGSSCQLVYRTTQQELQILQVFLTPRR